MNALFFTLSAPLLLPNRRGIASSRAAGAARVRAEREQLAWEVAALLAGSRPVVPFRHAAVQVFRHAVQEPDTDNLYTSCKALLDVLQPCGARRLYGLGIIENDKPSRCILSVRHMQERHRTAQCTRVVVRELGAQEFSAVLADAPAREEAAA